MLVPGVALVRLSVFVIDRSADRNTVSLSVALLSPGAGSVVPTGAVTVAVFEIVPVAANRIGAVTVYVASAAESRSTVVEMLAVPLAASQLPVPLVMAQVQLTDGTSKIAGLKVSATVASAAFEEPPFDTTIV